MKYTRMQRSLHEDFITIGEIVLQTQPGLFRKLYRKFELYIKDVTAEVLAAADMDNRYKYLMQERPKGGRGGLLPGEGEDALI